MSTTTDTLPITDASPATEVPLPTYVYKLISPDDTPPEPLPDALPVSELDSRSGFVHLSTAQQLPNTLKYFFTPYLRVHILRIPYAPLEAQIRWEDPEATVCGPRPAEGRFPHLYNGLRVGREEVESVATWERAEGEQWAQTVEKEKDWLIY